MNTDQRRLTPRRPTHGTQSSAWAHALIWVLLVVAALLLVSFTAVVNDITERGEARRAQQRVSGSFVPLDELQKQGADVLRLLFTVGEKPVGH